MGTKASPSAYDCCANAEQNEPMFILLARDKHAPALVWLWSVLRELDGEKPEKVAEARQCLMQMMAWAHEHGRQCVGLGQAVLAGTLELVRAANYGVQQEPKNEMTSAEFVRRLLARTEIEKESPS